VQRVPVGIGVDGDRDDVRLGAGANDSNGYFATVGYQQLFYHTGSSRPDSPGYTLQGFSPVARRRALIANRKCYVSEFWQDAVVFCVLRD
jgi:hypothetical protein